MMTGTKKRKHRLLWNSDRDQTPDGAPTLDEVVVFDVDCFHLEQMGDNHYWFAATLKDGRDVHVNLWTRKAPIFCTLQSNEIPMEQETHV